MFRLSAWEVGRYPVAAYLVDAGAEPMNKQNLIIYKTEDGKASVALYARDGNVWLNQSQLAELFATSKQNVSSHIPNILEER